MARIAPAKRAAVVCENWNFGEPVPSAELDTERRTPSNASEVSRPGAGAESEQIAARARQAVIDGPRRLSSRASGKSNMDGAPPAPSLPRFRRRLGWRESDAEFISPAALGTETAAPLPRPPRHLLEEPGIRAALHRYRDDVKVETPFNVGRLRSLLAGHPNQPFVDSILWGLENGF